MIKELRVEHWKSFDQAALYIDPLTIVIGTNASGKSNLLEALVFLQRIGSGATVDQAINGNNLLPALRGGSESLCRRPAHEFSLEVVIGATEQEDYIYRIQVRTDGAHVDLIDETLTALVYGASDGEVRKKRLIWTEPAPVGAASASPEGFPVKHYVVAAIDSGMPWKLPIKKGLVTGSILPFELIFADAQEAAVLNVVLDDLKQIFVFDPIPSRMRDYAKLSDRLQEDGSNIAGVLAALDKERRTAVEQSLTNHLKSLPERDITRVWTELIGVFENDAMLYCEEGWSGAVGQTIDTRTMSDGTLRYLAIVTAMLVRPAGSLLVIEDVDNGLHPSRAGLLIEMLRTLGKERGIDVIVTTHNPALLDAAGVRMLPFITVAHRDGATGASRLTQLEDIAQLPKLMAGGSLGQLATAGRIEAALEADGT